MRLCTLKSTGELIEAQSGGNADDLQVLIDNAVSAGYSANDVEATVVTQAQYDAAITAIPPIAVSPSQLDMVVAYIAAQPNAPTELTLKSKVLK